MIGIYEIRCARGIYVGSSVNIARRWRIHVHRLRAGTHHSPHLQAAWNKYGESAFTMNVLETCDPALLLVREQAYLNALNPRYNIARVAGSSLGRKVSAETRAVLSALAKNRPTRSLESRARTSASMRGNRNRTGKSIPHTAESRSKIAAALRGHSVRESTRDKLRYARSPETRRRMSLAARNRRRTLNGAAS